MKVDEGDSLRKAAHFFICLWGFLFVAVWPFYEGYRGYLFVNGTIVMSGIIFLYVATSRLVEFFYWIKDE